MSRLLVNRLFGRQGQALLVSGLLILLACVLRKRHHEHTALWESHKHADAVREGLYAWRDCTGRAPSSATLKRSYRRLARQAHPDRYGSSSQFVALDEAHKQLHSPMQYNLRAAVLGPDHRSTEDAGKDALGKVMGVSLAVVPGKDGPRVRLGIDFLTASERGFWQLGLLAKGVSTIEYSGQDGKGYDLCCGFLADSKCMYKPYAELKRQHEQHEDGLWDSMYLAHDCPLSDDKVYSGVVEKPLHVDSDSLWAAVLELFDPNGSELGCVAFTFRMLNGTLVPLDDEPKVQL
mmetsp:Transcript_51595/g.95485  ORF Transcript_51595/g.95485 Transcript_51595/m.95485 type:complete len:291 (-) Transcript_51595:63-935(-)